MERNAPSETRFQPGRRLDQRRLILLLILTCALVAAGGWWGVKRVMRWTPARHQIASVVRGAIGVNETVLTPPQAYQNVPITPAQLQRWARHAQRTLGDYFTGRELTFWRTTARAALSVKNLHHGSPLRKKSSPWQDHAVDVAQENRLDPLR